jgi:hypothetical protein
MPDNFEYRTIEEQTAELKANGWEPKTPNIWKSPTGKLYPGTHWAWKVMRSVELSDETERRP